ncbi:hypothetical protein ACFLT9_00905 [Acidobacteriota bacterium]
MNKLSVSITIILTSMSLCLPSFAQFTQNEVTERKRIEHFLKTAEIIRHEDIGEGVTKPKRLYLRMGDEELTGVWKNPKGSDRGYREGWEYEIAAYNLDKLMDLNMIPPTVERKFRGRRGSLQIWVSGLTSRLGMKEQNITIPDEETVRCEKMFCIARAFDSLISNIDRTLQNTTFTNDWRMILIDHSRAFRFDRFYVDQLLYGKKGMRKMPFFPLPRSFVAKIRRLDAESIKRSVGTYLKKVEIQAVLKRAKILLNEIDEEIRIHGAEQVLY